MKAEGSGLVGSCRHDSSTPGLTADYDRFSLKLRVEHLLYRDEESVEVDVDDGSFCRIVTLGCLDVGLF